jgi:hypothetical protein
MNNRFFFHLIFTFFLLFCYSSSYVFSQVGINGKSNAGNLIKPATVKILKRLNGIEGVVVQYNDTLFRGGKILNIDGINSLKENSINVIISTIDLPEIKILAKKNGIAYFYISLNQEIGLTAKNYKIFLKATSHENGFYFFASEENKKYEAGVLCALYRIKYENWSYENAMREFLKLGGRPVEDKLLMESIKPFLKK